MHYQDYDKRYREIEKGAKYIQDSITNNQCKYIYLYMLGLLADCKHLYEQDGWTTGGYLHILLDDGNLDDSSILFCKKECEEHPEDPYSSLGITICDRYLKMSMKERRIFDRLLWKWDGTCETPGECDKCKYAKED